MSEHATSHRSWVLPSGLTVELALGHEHRVPNTDFVGYDAVVTTPGGTSRTLKVHLLDLPLMDAARRQEGLEPLEPGERERIVETALLRLVDTDPEFFDGDGPLEVGPTDAGDLKRTPRISDRELRRYIARRLYVEWAEKSFDRLVYFEDIDESLTGCDPVDFLRNLQLLDQEGYVRLDRTLGPLTFASYHARATARLIRDVELYGAASDDVDDAAEFGGAIGPVRALEEDLELLMLQRSRFQFSQTSSEIVSVFRAIMPTVESVVRRLLTAHGAKNELASLGPMIAQLKNRGIGTRGLWSELSGLQTLARDVALHGHDMSPTFLKFGCSACFDVILQLGSFFPADEPPAA